ncbi:MAG: ACT domain-containing protein [Eubacterium sp.]
MLIKQISVFIENKKGHLATITGVVSGGGVNIRAISVFDSSEFGILRMVVDDPYQAVDLLKEAGHVTRVVDVLAVEPEDKLGAMHEIFRILADADINVEYVYSFVMRGQGEMPQVIMKTSDLERAASVLKAAGVVVIPKEMLQ